MPHAKDGITMNILVQRDESEFIKLALCVLAESTGNEEAKEMLNRCIMRIHEAQHADANKHPEMWRIVERDIEPKEDMNDKACDQLTRHINSVQSLPLDQKKIIIEQLNLF